MGFYRHCTYSGITATKRPLELMKPPGPSDVAATSTQILSRSPKSRFDNQLILAAINSNGAGDLLHGIFIPPFASSIHSTSFQQVPCILKPLPVTLS